MTEISFNNETIKYHFKIQNVGRNDISISSLYITLCYEGEFYNIKGIGIPFLPSEKNANRMGSKYIYERLVSIDVSRIKPESLRKSNDDELIRKSESGQLVLHDFIKKDDKLQIYVGLMAINYRFNRTKYYKETLKKCVEGEYGPGQCFVEKAKTPTAD